MKIVDHATARPNRCAVIPYLGNSNASGFIDTGQRLDLEHVYVSFEAVCEMAAMLGWVGASVKQGLEEENAVLKARVEQLEAEVAEADRYRESIDYISGSGPMKPYKKPGRPKKETATP